MNLSKMKMEISPASGRTMYGIMDETGSLQYGQVFIQISKSIHVSACLCSLVQVMIKTSSFAVPGAGSCGEDGAGDGDEEPVHCARGRPTADGGGP